MLLLKKNTHRPRSQRVRSFPIVFILTFTGYKRYKKQLEQSVIVDLLGNELMWRRINEVEWLDEIWRMIMDRSLLCSGYFCRWNSRRGIGTTNNHLLEFSVKIYWKRFLFTIRVATTSKKENWLQWIIIIALIKCLVDWNVKTTNWLNKVNVGDNV